MSDQVAVMNGGRFEQVGTPRRLYYRPATAFVAGFVGDSHRWSGRVESADGGRLTVRSDTGVTLAAQATDPLVAGARVDIFVRPEAVEIVPAATDTTDAGGVNLMHGILESLLFNGAASRAMVRLSEGDLVGVALPQTLGRSDLAEGAAVRLRFAADQATAFPAAGTAR